MEFTTRLYLIFHSILILLGCRINKLSPSWETPPSRWSHNPGMWCSSKHWGRGSLRGLSSSVLTVSHAGICCTDPFGLGSSCLHLCLGSFLNVSASGVLPPPQQCCQEIRRWPPTLPLTLPALLCRWNSQFSVWGKSFSFHVSFTMVILRNSKCKAKASRIFKVGLFSDLPHASLEAISTMLT